jgi:hypothetical protein
LRMVMRIDPMANPQRSSMAIKGSPDPGPAGMVRSPGILLLS